MGNKNKLALALLTATLLLALALGAAAPGAADLTLEWATQMEVWDGMHGLMGPSAGGSSTT
jgi:hypothetical protein